MPQPPDSPRPGGGPRPVVTGLLVAVLAAIGGAAIAHEAWTSNHHSGGQNLSQPPFGGQFGQISPSQGGNGASTGSTSASTKVASIAAKVDPGIVDIDTVLANGTAAAGTGMVVTAAGEVITNNHVITEATRISATDIGNGSTYNAHVIGYDTSRDIAVVQLEHASGLPARSRSGLLDRPCRPVGGDDRQRRRRRRHAIGGHRLGRWPRPVDHGGRRSGRHAGAADGPDRASTGNSSPATPMVR